jgi:hypothetical protein
MPFLLDPSGKPLDLTNPDNLSDTVLPEYESRKRVLNAARSMGCEREMLMIFAKYDKLARTCRNDSERLDISHLGCVEIYALLGRGGDLVIDGKIVYSTPVNNSPQIPTIFTDTETRRS